MHTLHTVSSTPSPATPCTSLQPRLTPTHCHDELAHGCGLSHIIQDNVAVGSRTCQQATLVGLDEDTPRQRKVRMYPVVYSYTDTHTPLLG